MGPTLLILTKNSVARGQIASHRSLHHPQSNSHEFSARKQNLCLSSKDAPVDRPGADGPLTA